MNWTLRDHDEKRRVMLLVSKFDHCLVDLLYRQRIGELPMIVTAVVANHPRENYAHIDFGEIPFRYLPVTRQTKAEQEAKLWSLIGETATESSCSRDICRCFPTIWPQGLPVAASTSTTPSCLASGAKPYHHAHARGVKLIGPRRIM